MVGMGTQSMASPARMASVIDLHLELEPGLPAFEEMRQERSGDEPVARLVVVDMATDGP